MPKIHIVEDDATLRGELENLLSLQGFDVSATEEFISLEKVAAEILMQHPDCVVLDLKLPSPDRKLGGHAICRRLREDADVPIIVLTSMADEYDEVMAFNLGADDYVMKPYRPAVLLARIQSALKAHAAHDMACASSMLNVKGVSLDIGSSIVSYEGRSAVLSRNEAMILSMLMECSGQIVARQDLMCRLWESDRFVDDNTLTVNVNRLRKSLSSIGVPQGFIDTRRGQGYVV